MSDATAIDTSDAQKQDASIPSEKNNYGFGPNVYVSSHPILSHKISILRSSATRSGTFRAVLKELTYHLGYEATRTLQTVPMPISVPVVPKITFASPIPMCAEDDSELHADCIGSKLKQQIALIPILRSGLGMVDSMMELVPNAQVHHIGMYKSSIQDHPVLYYNRLPRKCISDVAYVLDPCIATASTVKSVVTILKKWGVAEIHVLCVIGCTTGIKALLEEHPDISVTVGTIDEYANGQLIPGLGDSGDRLFGIPIPTIPSSASGNTDLMNDAVDEDDEELIHPSRRKRTMSQQQS